MSHGQKFWSFSRARDLRLLCNHKAGLVPNTASRRDEVLSLKISVRWTICMFMSREKKMLILGLVKVGSCFVFEIMFKTNGSEAPKGLL